MKLGQCRHWIFDLDGTLTVAIHDFDVARRRLGLPRGAPILETIRSLPAKEAAGLLMELDQWEASLVERALVANGALALLGALAKKGARLGILTRNSKGLALRTLQAVGLQRFFAPAEVLGRDCAAPKPSPEGVQRLLHGWGVAGSQAVMVGDYLFDLQAGRAAGAMAIWVDAAGGGQFAAEADLVVRSLAELAEMIG